MLRLFQVRAGQVGQGRGGRAACGPGVNLRARLRRSEGRVHPKKTVHGSQELFGEEVYVFEEADEDTVLRVEGAPVIQRAQVIRPPSGTFTAEYPEEVGRSERGVGRCDLSDHLSFARLEERSVPSVTRDAHVVGQVPREVLSGELPQVLSCPAPDLAAPPAVGAGGTEDPTD